MSTQAEMLCRKAIIARESLHGQAHSGMVRALLQMAGIGAAQSLYNESADHAAQALKIATALGGPDCEDAAKCNHHLALCR